MPAPSERSFGAGEPRQQLPLFPGVTGPRPQRDAADYRTDELEYGGHVARLVLIDAVESYEGVEQEQAWGVTAHGLLEAALVTG